MPPVSTIKRLPPDLRAAIEEQIAQGRTLDEVTAAVRDMGAEVSRSAVGRYKVRLDKILERSRATREIATVLANTVGRGGTGELIRGNAELLHSILLSAVDAVSEGENVTSKDAMMLSVALEKLASAAKKGAELERLEADAASAVVDAEGAPVSAPSQIKVVFVPPTQPEIVAVAPITESQE